MSTLSLDSHTFDPRATGTLLADFDRLLELIGDRGLALSPKHAFAAPSLEAINQRLTKPVRLGLKRAMHEIQVMPPEEGQGWRPSAITLTPWGQALLSTVLDARNPARTPETAALAAALALDWLFDPIGAFEDWSHSIRPALPEWQQDLEPPEADFQPGAHQFKVSLGARCWRRIRCGGETDLAELASTILIAFDFEEDHLYRFSYQNRFGQTIEIDHPDLADETDNAVADAVRIGELSLTEGQRIEFLFDFGDDWRFEIVAERPESGPVPLTPLILESHGETPAQYGDDWDD